MENDDIFFIIFFILILFINIIIIFSLLGLSNDLSNEVTRLRQENTELRQNNIALKWELDQVDQMICVNEELNYEK